MPNQKTGDSCEFTFREAMFWSPASVFVAAADKLFVADFTPAFIPSVFKDIPSLHPHV